MARVGSYATCVPWRWFHTPARVHSRPKAPRSVFSDCIQRTVATGGRRWSTCAHRHKRAFDFPIRPYWHWSRLLGRVFDLDMATCPLCHCGALRIIAAITQESVIIRILGHLKLTSVPPPIAPARCRQELFAFD
jgi:hypothetical protein